MASNISNASDYSSGVSGREGFGYSGNTSDTSYVGDDPSGGEVGLAGLFSPNAFSDMDIRGEGGRTGGRADFGVGYGRSSIPTAQNILANSGQPTFGDRGSPLNMNEFMALKGISAADPFAGSKKFGFSDNITSFMGGLDYRGQRDTIDDLQRQYSQYFNPYGESVGLNNVLSVGQSGTGLDQNSLDALQKDFNRLARNPNTQGNKEKGDLREGLQREYGSIFGGSPIGLETLKGNVVDQDRQFSKEEMIARGLASLAPGPIGTIISQVGKTKPTLDTSPTYKAELDPNSPDYEGSGYLGQLINMLTGGAGTQITDKIFGGDVYNSVSETGTAINDFLTNMITRSDSYMDGKFPGSKLNSGVFSAGDISRNQLVPDDYQNTNNYVDNDPIVDLPNNTKYPTPIDREFTGTDNTARTNIDQPFTNYSPAGVGIEQLGSMNPDGQYGDAAGSLFKRTTENSPNYIDGYTSPNFTQAEIEKKYNEMFGY